MLFLWILRYLNEQDTKYLTKISAAALPQSVLTVIFRGIKSTVSPATMCSLVENKLLLAKYCKARRCDNNQSCSQCSKFLTI